MPVYPGDPLTPGVGATQGRQAPAARARPPRSPRFPCCRFPTATRSRCWRRSTGRVAPAAGAARCPSPITSGPGPAKVHLQVKFNWDHQAALRRDRAHSRRRVSGRVDHPRQPSRRLGERRRRSALRHAAALMEEARALGELLSQGWKPKRTILLCVWDGEEPGLLGSTEWAEDARRRTARNAAVYINSDSNGRGLPGASPARTRWRSSSTAWRAISRTRKPRSPSGSAAASAAHRRPTRATATAGRTRRSARTRARPAHRRAGLRLRLHRVPRSPRRRVAQPGLRRRRRRRHLPLHLRRFLLVHAFLRHRFRLRPRAGADRRHGRDAPGRRRPAAASISTTSPTPSAATWTKCRSWRATSATRSSSATARSTKACSRPSPIRALQTVPPHRETVPPFLNFAPLENGLAALQRAAALTTRRWRRPPTTAAPPWRALHLREVNARLWPSSARSR